MPSSGSYPPCNAGSPLSQRCVGRFAALIGLLSLGSAGCTDTRTLLRLADALKTEFAGTAVGVALTDRIVLTVTATDSVLALASCETQVGFAMRVGRFLRAQYADVGSLQVVNVRFTQQPERGEVPLRHAHLPIRFNPAAVAAGLQAQDSVTAVGSCRAFEELNQPQP